MTGDGNLQVFAKTGYYMVSVLLFFFVFVLLVSAVGHMSMSAAALCSSGVILKLFHTGHDAL